MATDRSHIDPNDNLGKLLDMLDQGINPIIQWVSEDILEFDCYSVNDKCKVIDYEVDGIYENEIVYELKTDFSEFEEENKVNAKANWYNDNGNACLKWHETKYYPKDKRVILYMQLPTAAGMVEEYNLSTGFYFKILNLPAAWLIQPQEIKILCVSTSHMKMEDRIYLDSLKNSPLILGSRGTWIMLEAGSKFAEEFQNDKPEELSQALWDILIAANDAGYDGVKFDYNGKVYSRLETFEWG
jgi:hypothetical protein